MRRFGAFRDVATWGYCGAPGPRRGSPGSVRSDHSYVADRFRGPGWYAARFLDGGHGAGTMTPWPTGTDQAVAGLRLTPELRLVLRRVEA